MRHRLLFVIGALVVVVVASLAPMLVASQTATTTAATEFRTSWGHPDLQGVWLATTPTPLERPPDGGTVVRTEAEADRLEQELARRWDDRSRQGTASDVAGAYNAFWQERGRAVLGRSSLIVDPPDGRLPPLTPEGQAVTQARNAVREELPGGRADGPEDRRSGERCLHWERYINGVVNQAYRIVQSPGYVAINSERLHENRVIPLDGRPHLPSHVGQWKGDSRGRWDGNTLVVEITNFTDLNTGLRTPTTRHLHVVERFTRVDEDTISYEATITDPMTWVRPWTLALPLRRELNEGIGIFEYACHEGNLGMGGILRGARAAERAARQ